MKTNTWMCEKLSALIAASSTDTSLAKEGYKVVAMLIWCFHETKW